MDDLILQIINGFSNIKYSNENNDLSKILKDYTRIEKELTNNGKNSKNCKLLLEYLRLFCMEEKILVRYVIEYLKNFN